MTVALRFHFRQPIRIGSPKLHFQWNFTQAGYTGWGIHVWRWSYNNRTGRQAFDTPGPGGLRWGGRKRGQR